MSSLLLSYNDTNKYELGIDEAGRGPLFGRLYVASVVLPKDGFDGTNIKDSKKIKNKKKMDALATYIKEHALAWSIQYIENDVIDKINIRQAVFKGMHLCIQEIFEKLHINIGQDKTLLLVDGNDFKPYTLFDENTDSITTIPHEVIEGGDNKYMAIAAASILAKSERDNYIYLLCKDYPELITRYGIETNMGYGTKKHLDGILEWGITQWHRDTYGRCKGSKYNPLSNY